MFEFRSHLRGPRPYAHFAGAGHNSFTDFVWLIRQLGLDADDFEDRERSTPRPPRLAAEHVAATFLRPLHQRIGFQQRGPASGALSRTTAPSMNS